MSSEHAWLESCATGARLALGEFAVVGRGSAVGLRVDDAGVSREHASLRRKDGGWWVQDMGSANGTFVNGLPASVSTRLRGGDQISFGPARYVFREEGRSLWSGADETMEMSHVARSHGDDSEVTLLVSDIMGFSEVSTRLPAAEIARATSVWCGHCRAVLHDCGGHIDKFIGDCVFAWWKGGTPGVKSRALEAARLLNEAPPELRRLSDGTELRCGTGLHTGEAALSRLGPSSYTLMGADVNLVFRIESLTRKLEPVVVSRPFANGWPANSGFTFPSLGAHRVKGWHVPVEVCAVRGGGFRNVDGLK